jgi:hypothetical protein
VSVAGEKPVLIAVPEAGAKRQAVTVGGGGHRG